MAVRRGRPPTTGIKTPFLPADPDTGFEVDGMVAGPDAPAPAPEFGQCVHKAIRHPGAPDRLMLQHHWGIYRSDDRGTTWQNVGSSVPSAAEEGYELSPFGFPIVAHPRDPDTAWVLPLGSEMQRWTVDGRCRVYRTRDAGRYVGGADERPASGARLPHDPARRVLC